ncbi:MAG: hypothetical protein AAGA87_15210 [Pseudomonadota bacterium]
MSRLAFVLICLATTAAAQVYEPARGTAERANLMEALRPHAEWALGAPVIFVIDTLRSDGATAFATVEPQRPEGSPIDLDDTPLARRGEDFSFYDGTTMHAIFQKSGETWVAVHWAIGPTDVWWAAPELCEAYGAVLPVAC